MPGISLGLSRISKLLDLLRSPHLAVPVIHVAGTNGKGSVCAYVSSILNNASIRVGTFNSPHLVDVWDCVKIGEQTIDQSRFYSAQRAVQAANETHKVQATSFELLTATAFVAFAQCEPKLDVAVVEVGMGGLSDATNVVPAQNTLLSILTPVSLDHQKFLGDTVQEIAKVKAGIIKPQTDVVLARQEFEEAAQVIRDQTRAVNAMLHEASDAEAAEFDLPESSSYQRDNVVTAITAVQVMRRSHRAQSILPKVSSIQDAHIQRGLERSDWHGRLSRLSLPLPTRPTKSVELLVDGAHNASSIEALARYIRSLPADQQPVTFLTALSHPRSPSLLEPLLSGESNSITRVLAYGFDAPEGMEWISCVDPDKIASHVQQQFPRVQEALSFATFEEAVAHLSDQDSGRAVLVAGSLYGISQVYKYARRNVK